ncbi:lytic transglycosylase domain-containing protein (plasmid) [Lichenicola cladoniae]|uniref:Lytic transglycosylase domain-containing protein n=1 Tax=Lichenicola cladoniae TaxID=1484109 RepID=A0A6M8HYH0_9PROT|nr:lytic transglycosylase domain-containing protein [Lichenicola cladoniae]NPD66335.1 lytic transglycosylase domain-containing protein [Acetobacteraceae bacterium]QKE93131.1 lytic transglycosylase domain-containing protein [Lichenicola cladoniae]
MKVWAGLALAIALSPIAGHAAEPTLPPVVRCIESAAAVHRVPPAVVVILLSVEGGTLGHVSQNTNGTVDIGPMQVNTIWVSIVAKHWGATSAETYAALRDNFCANVEAGTWILRQAMDQAHGDFWEGVGLYHSHDPGYKADYLRKVLRQALRLQTQAQRQAALTPTNRTGS